jgi:hypothetical protein
MPAAARRAARGGLYSTRSGSCLDHSRTSQAARAANRRSGSVSVAQGALRDAGLIYRLSATSSGRGDSRYPPLLTSPVTARCRQMQSWLVRRRARIERTDAEAEALIRDFSDEAYSEARRREQEASSDDIAKNRRRVALAVALKMGRGTGIDPSTRIEMNALFVPDREPSAARLPRMKP